VPFATVRGWIGYGARRLLETALGRNLAEAEIQAFSAIYLAHCGRNSRLYDGVAETLDALRAGGVRTAVMTNKERRFALPVLAAHGLLGRMDEIVCGDSLPHRKPHPMPVLDLAMRAGVTTAQTLVIGDSAIDVAAARGAGAKAWAIEAGYGDAAALRESRPDRIVPSFRAAAALLDD
jgi:phosphoglycolate phosphatase